MSGIRGNSEPAPMNALVLGGGGPAGASWTSAFLHGLASGGLPPDAFGTVMGTSAGAAAGAWLTMRPEGLPGVAERMRERAASRAGAPGGGQVDTDLVRRALDRSARGGESALDIARAAVAALSPISADAARSTWAAALPEGAWPGRLRVTAVDARTGRASVWSARDDIPLAVAVAASTAAPGVSPPVEIAGSVWVDGGVRSNTNADLLLEIGDHDGEGRAVPAEKPGRVLVLAPRPTAGLARETDLLVAHGYRVRVVGASPLHMSPADLLDPRVTDTAAATGSVQAHDLAGELAEWWYG